MTQSRSRAIGDGRAFHTQLGVLRTPWFGLFCLFPLAMFAHTQVVAVIVEQFLQAGAAHVGELDLGFLGGERGFAAFEDVLLP